MSTGGLLVMIIGLVVALLGWLVALYEKRRVEAHKARLREAAATRP
jgi:uncharacterized membrane protein YgaE (UPF0421/DUF939 family)